MGHYGPWYKTIFQPTSLLTWWKLSSKKFTSNVTWLKKGKNGQRSWTAGKGREGLLNKFLYGEAPPWGPTPHPFIYHFSRKRCPFRTPSIDKRWYPFYVPCSEFCTLFTAVNALSFNWESITWGLKRYPFRAGSPRMGHHRNYPPPPHPQRDWRDDDDGLMMRVMMIMVMIWFNIDWLLLDVVQMAQSGSASSGKIFDGGAAIARGECAKEKWACTQAIDFWQHLTPAERVTRSGTPGYPPWEVILPIM